jgi:predicted small lipoprotein YifL
MFNSAHLTRYENLTTSVMLNLLRIGFILALFCSLGLLSACGLKGPLVLPEQPRPAKQKPGTVTSPQSFIFNSTYQQHA